MTHDELDAMPEFERFEMREVGADASGRRLVQAFERKMEAWSIPSDDDPLYAIDRDGRGWTFARLSGVMRKIRRPYFDAPAK